MEQTKLLDAHVQVRRMYNLLTEVEDLTIQMAQSLDRNDSMALQLLMSMREEPIRKMAQARDALFQQLEGLNQEDAMRLRALLNGEKPIIPEEKGLADQVAMNSRLMERVKILDSQVNRKITRDKSVYN